VGVLVSLQLAICLLEELLRVMRYKYWRFSSYTKYLPIPETLRKSIENYVKNVEKNPQDVVNIAEKIYTEIHYDELFPRFTPIGELKKRLEVVLSVKNVLEKLWITIKRITEIEDKTIAKFAEAIDLLLEHIAIQLLWFLENPEDYSENMSKFLLEYKEDAKDYIILTISAILLLKVLEKQRPLWYITDDLYKKREIAIENLAKVAEELESFTVTFQLMKKPIPEEELKVIASTKSVEELQRVLGYE